jgi:hypothetical protein
MDSNKRIIVFVLNLVFFLCVLYLVYVYVYSGYRNEYNEKNKAYDRFSNINVQLNDFVNIQTSMEEQKDTILKIISSYQDTFVPNSQKLNSYKEQVIKLLSKNDIEVKENSVTQIQNEKNIFLEININAKYAQICKFLFEIENFSKVLEIKMDYKGNVFIKCAPILFSDSINDNFSGRGSKVVMDDVTTAGYFKEIFDKIQSLKEVGYIPTWRDFEPIPKDPFYFYVAPKKVKKVSYGVDKSAKPEIVIDGIMYEKKNPIVIIEGKFYYTGDRYKKAKIVKINQNNIKVENYGKVYTIKMEN